MMEVSDGGHHVHFSKDTDELGNTLIVVKEKSTRNFEAHVGFLQILHRYLLCFNLPLKNASDGYVVKELDVRNLYSRVLKLQEIDHSNLQIEIEFFAHKEKLLREKIIIVDPDGNDVNVTIFARVLGKGKGTPMLRDGVTCTGVEMDEESEASDWQGFD